MTNERFSSVDDVVRTIREMEPAFAELRTDDLRQIVTENTQHGCANLTDDEIAGLIDIVRRATVEKPTA